MAPDSSEPAAKLRLRLQGEDPHWSVAASVKDHDCPLSVLLVAPEDTLGSLSERAPPLWKHVSSPVCEASLTRRPTPVVIHQQPCVVSVFAPGPPLGCVPGSLSAQVPGPGGSDAHPPPLPL